MNKTLNSKYKVVKCEIEAEENDIFMWVRYKYNNNLFRVYIPGKDKENIKQKFLNTTHGDWCHIHSILKT